jgi:hypothetical protein
MMTSIASGITYVPTTQLRAGEIAAFRGEVPVWFGHLHELQARAISGADRVFVSPAVFEAAKRLVDLKV